MPQAILLAETVPDQIGQSTVWHLSPPLFCPETGRRHKRVAIHEAQSFLLFSHTVVEPLDDDGGRVAKEPGPGSTKPSESARKVLLKLGYYDQRRRKKLRPVESVCLPLPRDYSQPIGPVTPPRTRMEALLREAHEQFGPGIRDAFNQNATLRALFERNP